MNLNFFSQHGRGLKSLLLRLRVYPWSMDTCALRTSMHWPHNTSLEPCTPAETPTPTAVSRRSIEKSCIQQPDTNAPWWTLNAVWPMTHASVNCRSTEKTSEKCCEIMFVAGRTVPSHWQHTQSFPTKALNKGFWDSKGSKTCQNLLTPLEPLIQ